MYKRFPEKTQVFFQTGAVGTPAVCPSDNCGASRTVMLLVAGEEGIEPSFSVLETDVLPLNYSPSISSGFACPAEALA